MVLHRPEDLAEFFKPEFVIKDYVNAGANVPEQAGVHAASGAPVVFSAATGLTLKKGTHDLNGALHAWQRKPRIMRMQVSCSLATGAVRTQHGEHA